MTEPGLRRSEKSIQLFKRLKSKLKLTFIHQILVKNKKKVMLNTIIVAFSFFMLLSMGNFSNTLSYITMSQASTDFGNCDIIISKDPSFDLNMYFDQNLLSEINLEQFQSPIPRLYINSETSKYIAGNPTPSYEISVCGINTTIENSIPNFGNIFLYQDGELTDQTFSSEIPFGCCLITSQTAELLDIVAGDTLFIQLPLSSLYLEVLAVVENDARFTDYNSNLIITNLDYLQYICYLNDQINVLMLNFKDPSVFYSVINLDTTFTNIGTVENEIVDNLGLGFIIGFPKVLAFYQLSSLFFYCSIQYNVIIFFAFLIVFIVLYSIFRKNFMDFGNDINILMSLGVPKRGIYTMGLMYNSVVVFGGILFGSIFSILIYSILYPIAILNSIFLQYLAIGLIIGLVTSLLPISQMIRVKISELNRKNIEIESKTTIKTILTALGVGLVILGVFSAMLAPFTMRNLSMGLFQGILSGIMICFVIGLSLVSSAFIPMIQYCILRILHPITKHINMYLTRNTWRRRSQNRTNMIVIAIIFSFIFMMSHFQQIKTAQVTREIELLNGSDITINFDSMTMEESIKSTISSISITEHASIIKQTFDSTSLSTLKNNAFRYCTINLFNGGFVYNMPCGVIGVDEDYRNVINPDLIKWAPYSGNNLNSLERVITENYSCIISNNLAYNMLIDELDTQVYLDIQWNYNKLVRNLTVVGISDGMPGFENFHTNVIGDDLDGVMINLDTYNELFSNITDCGRINKMMVAIDGNVAQFREDLTLLLDSSLDYSIISLNAQLDFQFNNEDATLEIINNLIVTSLILTVVQYVYNSMLDFSGRTQEINNLKAVGLKRQKIRKMFLIEHISAIITTLMLGILFGMLSANIIFSSISAII